MYVSVYLCSQVSRLMTRKLYSCWAVSRDLNFTSTKHRRGWLILARGKLIYCMLMLAICCSLYFDKMEKNTRTGFRSIFHVYWMTQLLLWPLNKSTMSRTAKVTPIFWSNSRLTSFLTLYFITDHLFVVLLNSILYGISLSCGWGAIANLDDMIFTWMMAETICSHRYEWTVYSVLLQFSIFEEILCGPSYRLKQPALLTAVCYNFMRRF